MAMEKKFNQITQIGIVTSDLEKMIKNYEEKMGIGPFKVIVDGNKGIGAEAKQLWVHGKETKFKVMVAVCQLGAVEIEIIQPLDDLSIYAEHLKKHGEGVINHIAIRSDDENVVFRKVMKAENVESMMKGNVDPNEGMSFEYFDTTQMLGTIIELHDSKPVD